MDKWAEFKRYWDKEVKPLAKEVLNNSTQDSEMINYYLSGMIFGVEHDLADGEPSLKAINGLCVIKGCFSDEGYYEKVHFDTPKSEIERMKELATKIKKLMTLTGD